MTNEHSNSEEDQSRSSDSRVQRWPGDPSGSGARSNGKLGEGLDSDRSAASVGHGLPEKDDALDAELVERLSNKVSHELTSVMRIAPIPDPRELEAYEQVQPGLANRIVSMAEDAADAANSATRSNAAVNNAIATSIVEEARSLRRGQWMFVSLAAFLIASSVLLELNDKTPIAAGFAVSGFLALFGVVIRPKMGTSWIPSSKSDQGDATS